MSCSGTTDFGLKRKKYTYIETSLGFLEESTFISSPCEPGGVNRWGSRWPAWELCGRAGWSRGRAAPTEERAEGQGSRAETRPGNCSRDRPAPAAGLRGLSTPEEKSGFQPCERWGWAFSPREG